MEGLKGDMYDFADIEKLVAEAKADPNRPKLVILKSTIGKGAPTKQGTNKVHGSPLGEEEIARAKETLGIPKEQKFWVAPEAYTYFGAYKQGLRSRHARWTEEFAAWKREEPALAKELDAWYSGDPQSEVRMPTFAPDEPLATRAASGKVLQAIAAAWPNFVGGSADLTSPNVSALNEVADYTPGNRSGRYIRFGIREHAMAAIGNGLMLHAGSDPLSRPSSRLSIICGPRSGSRRS